jgi:hypothetical protein
MSAPVQSQAPLSSQPGKRNRLVRWQRRVLGFSIVILTIQIGIVLTTLPWLSNWDQSWIPVHSSRWNGFWMSPYFRAALSGLGVVNIYIGFSELLAILKSIFSPE